MQMILTRISKLGGAWLLTAAAGVCLYCDLNLYGTALVTRSQLKPSGSSARSEAQSSSPAQLPQDQKPDLSISIPDIVAFDQDSKKIHFYSDLVKGKVVVISFVFTTCRLICPMQGASLS